MSGEKTYQSPFENPEPMDFKLILSRYFRYWYLFVISIIFCLAGAYLFLRYTPPQYYISGTLFIKDEKSSSGSSNNGAFADLSGQTSPKNLDNEIGFLKSTVLMQRVLSELSMHTSYHIMGRVQEQEIYHGDLPIRLIVNKLDSASFFKPIRIHIKDKNSFELEEEGLVASVHSFGQQIKKPYGVFTVVASPSVAQDENHRPITIRFHDLRSLAKGYARNLNIAQYNKQASILTLSLPDAVPKKGKDILDKLIDVYNKEATEDKNLAASNTLAFIDERLKFLGTELSDVERNVEQFKRQNEVADVGSQVGQYLMESSTYNKQLTEGAVQIEVLQSIESYVKRGDNQHQLIPNTLHVQDPTLSGLISKFNELQLDRERLLRIAEPDNPLVQNVDEQLSNLRVNILENLGNVRNSLIINQRSLQAKSGQFGSKIQNVPTIERELLEISRQQEIKQALYLYLLQKREESALALAATVSNSRVIDPAAPDDYPFSPNKTTVFLAALMLGLGIPFAFVYVKGMFNDKVQTLKDVEKATTTPILGELAHSFSPDILVVTKANLSPVAEMFHLIRTNLKFATAGEENKVVLVTSSMNGEGKTFFSQNLGASLVLTGKKVLVLNLDLRKPTFPQELGLPYDVGVTDYLISDDMSVDEIVIPSQTVRGLYHIAAGSIAPNPVELMMSPKIESLINILKESFDHIIIDTAPVGQVADAFSLAPLIDSTIFIIRNEQTPKIKISIIDQIYRERKLNHPLIVLNDVRKTDSYGYPPLSNSKIKKKEKISES